MRGSWLLVVAAAALSCAEEFQVTKPAAGDTVAISDENYGKATVQIEWSVPEAIAERPVMLSLMQGDSKDAMVEVELIASDAQNNGTFAWTSYLDNIAPSGCNYSILAKSWTDFSYSGYFTITNPDDSGLDPSWTCPVDIGTLRPSEGSYVAPAGSTESDASAEANSDDSTSGGTSGTSNTADGQSNGSSGASTTTLAVAVAVPLVVLVGIFAVVLVLGIRRGWFVRKQDRNRAPTQSPATYAEPSESYPSMQEQGKESKVRVGELHGHDRPYQTDGNEIHQLYGDEGRR